MSFPVMNDIWLQMNSVLGLSAEPKDLTLLQISLRGFMIFIATLIMLRLADRRFLSKRSAFDAVVGFILASMLARAVNGSSAFFPTIGGGFVIITLHRLLAFLTRQNHSLGTLIKGKVDVLINNGEIDKEVMRSNNLSRHDVLEDLRMNGNIEDLAKVKRAYYERNGQVSVVKD